VLSTDLEDEQSWPRTIPAALRPHGPKALVPFTTEYGANRHCEPLASGCATPASLAGSAAISDDRSARPGLARNAKIGPDVATSPGCDERGLSSGYAKCVIDHLGWGCRLRPSR